MEIKNLIKESGRTTKWIAKKLEIPYGTLIAYLNGHRTTPKDLEQRIKELL